MSSQIISRQLNSRQVHANSDDVIAFVPMPAGTKLNNVWLDVSVQIDGSGAGRRSCTVCRGSSSM